VTDVAEVSGGRAAWEAPAQPGWVRLVSFAERGLIVDFVARSATKSTEYLFLKALEVRHACSTV